MSTVASRPTEATTITAAIRRLWASAMISKKVRRRVGNAILYIILLSGSVIFLYPLIWAFATSTLRP
jgi:hypothetical protein